MKRLRREIRGFSLQDTLTLDNFKIVEYYPYTSIVNLRIVESDRDGHSPFDEWLNSLWNEISTWLEKEKKIYRVNKTAVKLVPKDSAWKDRNDYDNFIFNSALYVGYKDNVVSIGMGVWQPDSYTKKYNKTF
jgi:hypothetical protein